MSSGRQRGCLGPKEGMCEPGTVPGAWKGLAIAGGERGAGARPPLHGQFVSEPEEGDGLN